MRFAVVDDVSHVLTCEKRFNATRILFCSLLYVWLHLINHLTMHGTNLCSHSSSSSSGNRISSTAAFSIISISNSSSERPGEITLPLPHTHTNNRTQPPPNRLPASAWPGTVFRTSRERAHVTLSKKTRAHARKVAHNLHTNKHLVCARSNCEARYTAIYLNLRVPTDFVLLLAHKRASFNDH